MVDSKTISIIWAYIDAFDRTGNPSYLITAMTMFKAVLEQVELPEDVITAAWKIEDGGHRIIAKGVEVNRENLVSFVTEWLGTLLDYYPQKMGPWVYQVGKASLVKILTALGYVVNPLEGTRLETAFESGEEGAQG